MLLPREWVVFNDICINKFSIMRDATHRCFYSQK